MGFSPTAAVAEDAVKGSADAGATKAAVCTACHGVNGNSAIPSGRISPARTPPTSASSSRCSRRASASTRSCIPIVEQLTEQDFADLAAYFAAQTPAGLEADPSYWKAGEALYKSGDAARNIPACTACHGPAGQGNAGAGYPALRAQHSVYTVKQLQDYLTKNRYRDATDPATVHSTRNSAMMTTIAARLTPEDIRNLASYLQGLR